MRARIATGQQRHDSRPAYRQKTSDECQSELRLARSNARLKPQMLPLYDKGKSRALALNK